MWTHCRPSCRPGSSQRSSPSSPSWHPRRAVRARHAARAGRLRDAAGADRRHRLLPAAQRKAYELARERVSVVNADLQESVAGLRMVQAFRRERRGIERFTQRSDGYRQARVRGQWLISVYFPFVQLLASLATAAVLVVGAGRIDERDAHGRRHWSRTCSTSNCSSRRCSSSPRSSTATSRRPSRWPHPAAAARGDHHAAVGRTRVRRARCAVNSPSRTCTSATPPPREARTRKRRSPASN